MCSVIRTPRIVVSGLNDTQQCPEEIVVGSIFSEQFGDETILEVKGSGTSDNYDTVQSTATMICLNKGLLESLIQALTLQLISWPEPKTPKKRKAAKAKRK